MLKTILMLKTTKARYQCLKQQFALLVVFYQRMH